MYRKIKNRKCPKVEFRTKTPAIIVKKTLMKLPDIILLTLCDSIGEPF